MKLEHAFHVELVTHHSPLALSAAPMSQEEPILHKVGIKRACLRKKGQYTCINGGPQRDHAISLRPSELVL
jgi:hypothetical protein